MVSSGETARRGKFAVAGLSGGVLAMIWGGVWYVAMASGRAQSSPQARIGCQVVFFAGVTVAVAAFFYLWANKLSVVDGSATHVHSVPPSEAETTVVPTLQSARQRA